MPTNIIRNYGLERFFGVPPDDVSTEGLEAEFRASVDTEELALAVAEAEEHNNISEAINNSSPFFEAAPLKKLQESDKACFQDNQESSILHDYLSTQADMEKEMKPIGFWNSRFIASGSPKDNFNPVLDQVEKILCAEAAHETNVIPNSQQTVGTHQAIVKTASETLNAYETAQWLIENNHVKQAMEKLFFYDGVAYQPKSSGDAKRAILDACRSAVKVSGKSAFVKQVYDLLMLEPRICCDADVQLNIVAFDDCLLDLDNWQLLPHTPEIFVTTHLKGSYQIGVRQGCPMFDAFLDSISLGDPLLKKRLWEVLGSCIVPDQNVKSFPVLQGAPNSGKSVYGNFARGCFVGDVVSALEINDLGGNFVLSDLVAKKLCLDLDLPADPFSKKAVSKLKKLTGQDYVSSDVKFCDRVKFYCSCKFLFGTNHAIVLPDEDPAFENRLVIVPFARSVPLEQRDFSLAKKLEQERSAIIVRALWAYKGLRENRYHYAGDFRPNAVLGSGQGFYIDKIAAFLNSFCEYEEGAWTATQTLFARFTETNGVSCPDKAFSRVFLQLCDAQGLPVERCRGRLAPSLNPIWGFRGIKLKNEV